MEKEPQKHKKSMVYYEKVLCDCEIVGCGCQTEFLHPEMDAVLDLVDPEILSAPFGATPLLPPDLEGCVVLDIGCGSGQLAVRCITSRWVRRQGNRVGYAGQPPCYRTKTSSRPDEDIRV